MIHRIQSALYGEPWLVAPETHKAMSNALDRYLSGNFVFQPRGEKPPFNPLAFGPGFAEPEAIPGVAIREGVAILGVSGILGKHLSLFEIDCGGGYDLARLENQLLNLGQMADVHTLVMIANSPGGQAMGPRDMALLAQEIAAEKRLVAWVDNKAASAMYYIAAAFPEIYTTPTAAIGSIGVYSVFLDRSREYEIAGKSVELFTSGPLKAAGVEGTALTDEQKVFAQERVSELAEPFFEFVRQSRIGVSESVFAGGWYGPEQAQALGLIDGTFPSFSHLLESL